MADNQLKFEKDLDNKKITVTRHFNAPTEDVWRAWTEAELLDQWWAPKPWKAETKTMDFREGGHWLYAMVGPGGERHWARADYRKIDSGKSFSLIDAFADEHGNPNREMPSMNWLNTFTSTGNGSKVVVEISFAKVEDLEKIIEMGFKEGFTAGLNQLAEMLAQKTKQQ